MAMVFVHIQVKNRGGVLLNNSVATAWSDAYIYPDGSFDLAFSIRLSTWAGFHAQRQFANELLRVGKRVYFQTLNRWFPLESCLIAVFIHWLPFSVARKIVRFPHCLPMMRVEP